MPIPLQNQLIQEICNIVAMARPLVESIERRDRDLGTQLRRALSSVALNVAEGFGCRAGHSRSRFETAHGSLFEVRAALGVAVAWGYISEAQIAESSQRMDALGGRIYGLMRR
jgi:four helix bundle protein